MHDFLSPLLLTSDTLLVTSTSAVQVDPTQMLNPNSTAMLVDQFRIALNDTADTADAAAVIDQIYVNIQVGALPITNGYVPAVSLCPAYDVTTSIIYSNPLVWHLPKPLYVPPNTTMFISLLRVVNADSGFSSNLGVRVAIAGRSLPSNYPVPDEIYVPWGSATVVDTNQTTTLATRQIYVSPDNMLGNPHDSDLLVTRFVGYRNDLVISALLSYSYNDIEGPNTTTVKLTVSNGKMLVREPTPFFHLFPMGRRYFDMRAVLRGKKSVGGSGGEFVRAQFSWQANDEHGATQGMNLMMLGMIGYRIAPTPLGATQGATGTVVTDPIEALRNASLDRPIPRLR
jgi:hypothetical protein